jgi:hypothetical protein
MNLATTDSYLSLLVISAATTVGLAVHAWRRRREPGYRRSPD